MNPIYIVGGIVSLALFIYLVIALLKPEAFQ
jgi:K+-transporting ATPase KdpF subunit